MAEPNKSLARNLKTPAKTRASTALRHSGDAALLGGYNMKSNGTLALAQSVYDTVHLALWATLVAFVLFFLAFIAPRLPEAAARAERLRIQEIAQENEGYCAKWQMGLGTKMHDQCILDLQELRAKVENRLADQLDF
jgi:hypothetical protein